MRTSRLHMMYAVLNGKIHVIGGGTTPVGPQLNVHEVYDPATDTWTTKAPLPVH